MGQRKYEKEYKVQTMKLAALDAAIQTERERIQEGCRVPNVSPAKLQVLTKERESLEKKYREGTAAALAAAILTVALATPTLAAEVSAESIRVSSYKGSSLDV